MTMISRATAITVLALCTTPLAPEALASFPGKNGMVAADRALTSRNTYELSLVLYDWRTGRKIRRLTHCVRGEFELQKGVCGYEPAFSHDGKRLAIALDRSVPADDESSGESSAVAGGLAVMHADGGERRPLPPLTEDDADPHWSPKGRELVFVGRRQRRSNLFVVGSDGSGLRQLTHAGGRQPSWSIRGQIAYVRRGRIIVLDPDSGRTRTLARGSQPEWDPSGRSLVYTTTNRPRGRERIWRVPLARPNRRSLLRAGTEPGGSSFQAVPSPDGRSLLFTATAERCRFDCYPGSLLRAGRFGRGRRTVLQRGYELSVGSTFFDYTATADSRNAPSLAWQPLQ